MHEKRRNEMIAILHAYTSTLRIPSGDETIDEHILDILEKAGMLPPETDKTDYCDCGYHNLGDLEWEDEVE